MAEANLPELQDALIRRFRLRSELPPLDLIPAVLPVVQVDPVSISLEIQGETVFGFADVFGGTAVNAHAIGVVWATTGALPGGVYEVIVHFSAQSGIAQQLWSVEHRNAFDTITLQAWESVIPAAGTEREFHLRYRLQEAGAGAGESLRVRNTGVAFAVGNWSVATIFAVRVAD